MKTQDSKFRLNVYLKPAQKKFLKLYAVKNDTNISKIVALLADSLKSGKVSLDTLK